MKKYLSLIMLTSCMYISVFAFVKIEKSKEISIIDGNKYYIHWVKDGQTAFSIARTYQTTIKILNAENPSLKKGLYIGQKLKIPFNKSDTPVFQEANNNQVIEDKRELEIPFNKAHKTRQANKQNNIQYETKEYIVKAGDNIYRLSINNHISLDELKNANPGMTDRIYIGDRICIPIKQNTNELINKKVERKRKFFQSTDSDQIEVRLIDKNIKEIMPGTSFNVVVMLVNGSSSTKEFKLKVSVPEAWNLLTNYSSVLIAKKSKQIKVLSFYVQSSTNVGTNSIIIESYNETDQTRINELKIPVRVKPKYELEIEPFNTPDYVISGDSLNVNFRIRNLSNTKVDVKAISFYDAITTEMIYPIESDSSALLSIPINTDKNTTFYSKKSVSITASILNDSTSSASSSFAFDIIPSTKMNFDAFYRYPIHITGLYISDNSLGESKSGYMLDVRGKGSISQRNKRIVEFHLRKPAKVEGNPLFGLNEEYYIKYSSNRFDLRIGDHNFRLSDLTESSRYGRGVGLEIKLNKLTLGSFYNLPRYYLNISKVYAAYGNLEVGKKTNFKVGYLNKIFMNDSIASLMMVSGEISPVKWADLNFEYAMGKTIENSTAAYKAGIRIRSSIARTFFNYTHADIDFPGYYSNSKHLSAGISTSPISNSSLSANYDYNHSNLALDSLYTNAPFSSNLSLSANFKIFKKHNLGLSVYMRNREDRMPKKLFHYKEMTTRLSLQSKLGRFRLNLYGEMGKIENLLELREGELTASMKSYFSLAYRFKNQSFIEGFANYQSGKYYEQSETKSVFYGLSINARIRKNLEMMLEYQSNYAIEEYNKNRSLVSARIKYALMKNHEISMSINYNLVKNTLNTKDYSALLSYNYRLNTPIAKKRNIGSLKGKVINNGIDKVEGIAFTLGGTKAFTDKDGNFEFPIVKVGEYLLLMDDSNTGLHTIADKASPYRVEITPGGVSRFEITLSKSARISGSLKIQKDKNSKDKAFIAIKDKLGSLIVEVSKGTEVYRIYTDKNGNFSFEDLRIGEWKLKVYDVGITSGYKLLTPEFLIKLTPGQEKTVEVLIQKKSRRIRFQKLK